MKSRSDEVYRPVEGAGPPPRAEGGVGQGDPGLRAGAPPLPGGGRRAGAPALQPDR